MNFLAHLWLAETAKLPLAGALLGDYLRGPLPPDMPPTLASSVQQHRRIDALTDRHPRVAAIRAQYAQGTRRYAGILLDILFDHALALDWASYSREPLAGFAQRAALAVAAEPAWFERAGSSPPPVEAFSRLLQSYAEPAGIERAVARTSRRMKRPEGLMAALAGWETRMPQVHAALPELLKDLCAG